VLNPGPTPVRAFTNIEVVNYQAPCKPGTSANVSTWHWGDSNRRAYDWRCKDSTAVYAPHGGKVTIKTAGYPSFGMAFVEDEENNACTVLVHLDGSKFVVADGITVKSGQQIGSYFSKTKYAPNGAGGFIPPHVHLVAINESCASNNYSVIQSKERPIKFNEIGYILTPLITLNGTQSGSDGPMIHVTVGSCASGGSQPCIPPLDEAPTGYFSDVPVTHTFFPYIETLHHLGISNGDHGLYLPDAPLTRGAAAKLVVEAIGEARQYQDRRQNFPDVPTDHTFYHYIERAFELGIVSGFSDKNFKPDEGVTRGALAKILVNAHDRSKPPYLDCLPIFPDLPCDHTFYIYIRRLKEIFKSKGISLGFSTGEFKPDDIVDRGAAAKLLIVGLDLEQHLPVFYDVAHDNIFFNYIKAIAERGITKGCDSSSIYPKFCPEDKLTRGQAAAFMVRAIGFTPNYTSGQTFPDVFSNDKFYQEIEYLARNGIVSGFSDHTFRPDALVTRGEIAKMIVNTLQHINISCQGTADPGFSDVPATHTFYTYIRCLRERNITSGYSDGTYRPDQPITRAETAKFMFLAFIQTTPVFAQESSDATNNYRTNAHFLNNVEQFVVPFYDTDWAKFIVSSLTTSDVTAAQTNNTYRLNIDQRTPNLDLRIDVEDAAGHPVMVTPVTIDPDQVEGSPDGRMSLLLPELPDGEYFIKLTNQKSFATEGVAAYLSVEKAEPGSSEETVHMPLQPGWNYHALPLNPNIPYTTESVCREIKAQGGNIAEIYGWQGYWTGHPCGTPVNDFPIEMGTGYFIRSQVASTWTIQGKPVTGVTPIDLQAGWNAISLPTTYGHTAASLCQIINDQSAGATQIVRWSSSGWDGHNCGYPFNDFSIERGRGYFVKVNSAKTVILSSMAQSASH
jgi:hypothetical protein